MADDTTRRVVHEDGSEYWKKGDIVHRLDGPAITYPDGMKEWWQNDLLHREDGPAVVYPDGKCEWWLNGAIYYEFSDWINSLDVSERQKTLLILKYSDADTEY